MKTLHSADIIFATFACAGRIVASLRLAGVSSITDVLRAYDEHGATQRGLMNLTLRNSTQGWSASTAVMV